MRQVNKPGVCDRDARPLETEFAITPGMKLHIPREDAVYTAAKDFMDFMYASMETSVSLWEEDGADMVVQIDKTYGSYKSYQITVTESGIRVLAHDARGAAQGLYRLEDRMLTRHAPFLKKGTEERAPIYSPRMTHSGYGLDDFPDEHLLQIAKAGMDAILVFVSDVNQTPRGYLDFNALIHRAALHGLDVYAYSYMRVFVHPEDAGAWERYDGVYGRLFRCCPDLKGVILVGESVGFPTKDSNAAPCEYFNNYVDGLPTGKPSADMWPCSDYREWIEMLKSVIFPVKPDADIVFWTYNWGCQPEKERVELIRSLPTDISLLVTYEMHHKYLVGNAVGHCADYTLAFEGPGAYFLSEAKAAKEQGIRLYAMTNTAGLTWDMGMIPYQPMPYQWRKRYETMLQAHEEWGMCGLMESHHYGFWPSFISEIAKEAFEYGGEDYDTALANALKRRYGDANTPSVNEALKLWSEAITYYIPSNEDQYAAFRVGPAYPFNLGKTSKQAVFYPSNVDFSIPKYPLDNVGKGSLSAMRIRAEITSLDRMLSLLKEGLEILKTLSDPNEELEYLVNFGRYLVCYAQTGVNAKRWYLCISHLQIAEEPSQIESLIQQAETLLEQERANVLAAIPCVKKDSRLGWEPRQEYRCNADQLDWKLRQLDYVRNTELKAYRNSIYITVNDTNVVADYFTL